MDLEMLLAALQGNAQANKKLALSMSEHREDSICSKLCEIFLLKAIELGDEESFLIYNSLLGEGENLIDEPSYIEMVKDYEETDDLVIKSKLEKYIKMKA